MNNPPDPGQGPPNPNGGISPSGSLFGRKKKYQPKVNITDLSTGLPTANSFSGTPGELGSPGMNLQAPQVMNYNFQNFSNPHPNHEITQNRVLLSPSNSNLSNQNQLMNNFQNQQQTQFNNNFQNQSNNQFGNSNQQPNFSTNIGGTGFSSGFNQQNNVFSNTVTGFGSPGLSQSASQFSNKNLNNDLFPSVSDLSAVNNNQTQNSPNRSFSLLSPKSTNFTDKRKQEFGNNQSEYGNKKVTNLLNSAFGSSNKSASTLPFNTNQNQPTSPAFNTSAKSINLGFNSASNVTFGTTAANPQTTNKDPVVDDSSKNIFNTTDISTGTPTSGFNTILQQPKIAFGSSAISTFGNLNDLNKEKETGTDKSAPISFGFGTSRAEPISFGNVGDASIKSANTNFGFSGQKNNERVEPSNQPADVNSITPAPVGTSLFDTTAQRSRINAELSNQTSNPTFTTPAQSGSSLFDASGQKSNDNAKTIIQAGNPNPTVPVQAKTNMFSGFGQNSGSLFGSLNKTSNPNPFTPGQNKEVNFGAPTQSKTSIIGSTTQLSKPINSSLTKLISLGAGASTQSEIPRFWEPSDPNAFINSNLAQPFSSKTGTSIATNTISFDALSKTNEINLPIPSQSNQNKRKDLYITEGASSAYSSNNSIEETPVSKAVKKTKSDNPENLTAREKWQINQMALAIAFKELLEEDIKKQNSSKSIEENLKNYYIKSQMIENLFKKAIEEEKENKPPIQVPNGTSKGKEQNERGDVEIQPSNIINTKLDSIPNQSNILTPTTNSFFNSRVFKPNQNEAPRTCAFGAPSVSTSDNLEFGQSTAKEAPKISTSNTFGAGFGQNINKDASSNPAQVNPFTSLFNQAPASKPNSVAAALDSASKTPKFSFGIDPAQRIPSSLSLFSSTKSVGETPDNISSVFGTQSKKENSSNSSTSIKFDSKGFQSSMWNTNKKQNPESSVNTPPAFSTQPVQETSSAAAQSSIFGAKPTQTLKTNPFGPSITVSSDPIASIFGAQPTQSSTSNPFGQSTAIPTDLISSVFGAQPTQETPSASTHSIAFDTKPIQYIPTNPFGTKPTQSTDVNPFGQPTSIPMDPLSSIFGVQPNQGTSTPGKSIVFGANPFSTQPSASSNIPTAQPVGSDDEGEDEEGFRGDRTNDELVKRGVGEEEEKTLYEARSKLQAYNNEKKSYESFGVGFLKVNHNVGTNKYRILFRLEGSGKLMINSYILDNCLQKVEEKRIVFKASTLEGRPTPFLASFKLPKECNDMADAIRTGQNSDSDSQDDLKDNEKQLTSLNSEHPNESIPNLKASELIHVLFPAKSNYSEVKQNDNIEEKKEVIVAKEGVPGPSSIVGDNFKDLPIEDREISSRNVYQQDDDSLISPFSNTTARELMTELFPEKKKPKMEHQNEIISTLDSIPQSFDKFEGSNLIKFNNNIENKEKQLNILLEDRTKIDIIEKNNCDHDIGTNEKNIVFNQLNQLNTKGNDLTELNDVVITEIGMNSPYIIPDKLSEQDYNENSKGINKIVDPNLKVEPYGYESGSQGLSSPTLAGDDLNFNNVNYKQFSLDNINDNENEFINNIDHSKVEHGNGNGNVSFIENSYSELMITGKGESYDEPQIEVRARAYGILPSDKSYFNLGVGPFKINYNTKKGYYRILCRQEGSGKLLINSKMIQDTPIKATQHKKYFAIKFKANNLDGLPSLYTIFVKTKEEADQLEIVFNKSILQSSGDVLEYD